MEFFRSLQQIKFSHAKIILVWARAKTSVGFVVTAHIKKQLLLRAKAALRAEAFAPGTGNKRWQVKRVHQSA